MSEHEIECALTGRLTADPVQRTGKSGKPWLAMNIAIGSGDAVQFVSVALFADSVPEVAGRLRRGDRAYVEGKITLRQWTGLDGHSSAGLSVASFHVVPLGQIGRRRPARAKPHPACTNPAARDWQRPQGMLHVEGGQAAMNAGSTVNAERT